MSSKSHPWKIISTKHVYKNQWLSLKENQVIRPDGKKGIFTIVDLKNGVSILPIDDEQNVYLVEQYRFTLKHKTTEVVCGGIEKGENILDAAKRELKEETGIQAEEWIKIGKIHPLTSAIKSINHLFLAQKLSFSKTNQEGTENIKLIKVSLKTVVDMVMQNEITNSISVGLILKVNNFLD